MPPKFTPIIMKLTLNKSDLFRELEYVRPAFSHRSATAQTLRLSALNGTLQIEAVSPIISYRSSLTVSVESEGSCDVKGALLLEVVRTLSKGEVTLDVENGDLVVAQPGFTAKLRAALDFSTMPPIETDCGVTMSGTTFAALIAAVRAAVTRIDLIHLKACAMMEFRPTYIRLVGMDGHRLSMATTPCALELTRDIFLPYDALDAIHAMVADVAAVALDFGESQMAITACGRRMTVGLVSGKYPAYQAFMTPPPDSITFTVDRDSLYAALKRTAIVAWKHDRVVEMKIEPSRLVVRAENQDDGMSAGESITAQSEVDGINVRMNATYITETIEAAPQGDIQFLVGNGKTPSVIIRPSETADVTIASIIVPLREKV